MKFKKLDKDEYFKRCSQFQDKSDSAKIDIIKEETDNMLSYLASRGFSINEILAVCAVIIKRSKEAIPTALSDSLEETVN